MFPPYPEIDSEEMYYHYNRFDHYAEKSGPAQRREDRATAAFDGVRKRVEHAKVNISLRTVRLGALDDGSVLSKLSDETLGAILDFVKPDGFDEYVSTGPVRIAKKKQVPTPVAPAAAPSGNAAAASQDTAQAPIVVDPPSVPAAAPPSEPVEASFDPNALYEPGNTLRIPLLKPNDHLTSACWRDFSRHVRSFSGWTCSRKAATPLEKKAYGEQRKGQVYFVDVFFKVPGKPKKKKAAAKKTATKKGSTGSTPSQKKKAPSKKRVVSPTEDAKPAAKKKAKKSV